MKILNKLRKAVNSGSTGHLPLKYRVELMKVINDGKLTKKLYFECAKKVFPIWEEEYLGYTPVYEMLQKADAYLYAHKGEKSDFLNIADSYKNYIEGIHSVAGTAGMTALYLCYRIPSEIPFDEEHNGKDDDNAYDYEDWTPDYYASMACSGAPPFWGEGDVEKRRAFWFWFIDTAEALLTNQATPILPLKEIKPVVLHEEPITRSEYVETESIKANILEIVELAEKFWKEKNIEADKLIVEGNCVGIGSSFAMYELADGKQQEIKLSISEWLTYNSVIDNFNIIKDEMYSLHPNEGAWGVCRLIVDKNQHYEITFEYDDEEVICMCDMESVVSEFKNYPRAKEYTPKWMQSVLGKKATYL